MWIKWHGHSCFEFSNETVSIVVDPHDGRSIGLKTPKTIADVVLMTHDHYDHNASRVIKGDHEDLKFFTGRTELKGEIVLDGYMSWHDHSQGDERGANTIYKFTMDGISICHCGDIGCIPSQDVIDQIHGVDFLFIPVGEVYTMELPEIKKFIELVNPNVIVPMHYMVGGLSFRLSTLDKFLDIIPDNAVDFIGNELEISKSELPEAKECWVFDH